MKKIFISTLFLLFAFASTTLAHSTLKTSNPVDGQIVGSNLSEITLQFDTKIESTSLVTLTNESGEEIPVLISVNNDTLLAKIPSPLEDGTYNVNWNIIGEDGHPINGSYLFMVNESEATSQTDNNEGTSFNWVMIIIGALVLVIFLSILTKPNKRRMRF